MNKIIFIIGVTFLCISISCKDRERPLSQHIAVTQEQNISIEYKAFSRGYFMAVSVDENRIKKYNDHTLKEFDSKKCSKKDWTSVLLCLDKITLEKIAELPAPSNKSSLDRKAQAQLKITSGKEIYTSANFDHGNPPEELKLLVDTILALTKSMN